MGDNDIAYAFAYGSVWFKIPRTVKLVLKGTPTADEIPEKPDHFNVTVAKRLIAKLEQKPAARPLSVEGCAWVIKKDNIDTDMLFHNRYFSITNINEMGQYAFGNLKGYENFAKKAKKGDIIIAGKNFGCGSSRQQAVDCFKSLGIGVIVAESFGAIYERNAINSAMPILVADDLVNAVNDKDIISVDFMTGEIRNKTQGKSYQAKPFSKVQIDICERGGLLLPAP